MSSGGTQGDRIRAILAPLAEVARAYPEWKDGTVVLADKETQGVLTMRHCRDAAKLLEEMRR